MIVLFVFLVLIPIVFLLFNKKQHFTQGFIKADVNANKNISVNTDEFIVSSKLDAKKICIEEQCLSKNDLLKAIQMHDKIRKAVCINEECVYEEQLNHLYDLWPIGSIVMYKGDIKRLPEGWRICDGSQGTPDLRDRFILGSSVNYRTVYKTLDIGKCGKEGGGLPNYSIQDINNRNECEKLCNEKKNCYGFNIAETTGDQCILWCEELSDKNLYNNDANWGNCFKKDMSGGESKHRLTLDEIPPHGHVMFSNNPGSEDGDLQLGVAAEVSSGNSKGNIVKNKTDFKTKLSFYGKDSSHENKPPFVSLYYVMRIDPDYKEEQCDSYKLPEEKEKEKEKDINQLLREQIVNELSQKPLA
jgi:hypothetical protein